MKKRVLSVTLMGMAIVVSLGACGGAADGVAANQGGSAAEVTAVPDGAGESKTASNDGAGESTVVSATEAPVAAAPETDAPATEVPTAETSIIEASATETPATEAPTEPETSEAESEESEEHTNLVDGMRPDFKEAMDSYEAFYDEYCDFMKKYNENPSDFVLIMEYADMLTRSAEMTEEFEEWNSDDLNDAEMKYYLEVNNRVMQKLADVAY